SGKADGRERPGTRLPPHRRNGCALPRDLPEYENRVARQNRNRTEAGPETDFAHYVSFRRVGPCATNNPQSRTAASLGSGDGTCLPLAERNDAASLHRGCALPGRKRHHLRSRFLRRESTFWRSECLLRPETAQVGAHFSEPLTNARRVRLDRVRLECPDRGGANDLR